MSEKRLAGWQARDLATHLEELASEAAAWRAGTGERRIVTLHLASGQRHSGLVLELVRGTVALQSLPQRGTFDLDVTVIPVARIEALTIHAAQARAIEALPETATSMLDLRRRAKALGDLLATRVGKLIEIEVGGELATVAPTFEALRVALDKVCSDELGRGSLAERVSRIEMRDGASVVTLANGVLMLAGTVGLDRLQAALDAAL